MNLAVVGHSLIHPRQQRFFQTLAEQEGWDVTLIAPGQWRDLRTQSQDIGGFHVRTLRHLGGDDVYRFKFVGLEALTAELEPDVVYVQQEPASLLASEVKEMRLRGIIEKATLFTWENIEQNFTPFARSVLPTYDLVVCGNDDAERLVQRDNPNTVVLPQVGINTDHFQARPDVARSIKVAYIGRPTREKGVDKLLMVWPTAFILPWTDYLQLPWRYSQVQVVVCYSQDTKEWREQAMPYVAVEAVCCGALAIVSDAGSIRFWHTRFAGENPGAKVVSQGSSQELRQAIEEWLKYPVLREQAASLGRQWVENNLSSRVIARRLAQCLGRL